MHTQPTRSKWCPGSQNLQKAKKRKFRTFLTSISNAHLKRNTYHSKCRSKKPKSTKIKKENVKNISRSQWYTLIQRSTYPRSRNLQKIKKRNVDMFLEANWRTPIPKEKAYLLKSRSKKPKLQKIKKETLVRFLSSFQTQPQKKSLTI